MLHKAKGKCLMSPVQPMACCEKPREKFLQQGAQAVTDQDLLAILLRTGVKGHSVLDVSRSLLRSLPGENLYYLSEASVADLCAIRGVGADKAVTICAAVELGRRIARQRVKQNAPDFSTPQSIAEYVMEDMRFLPQEQLRAVYLSTKNQLIAVRTLTIGTINSSLAKSREVFRFAIQYNAAAVVLVHNHPSGDPVSQQRRHRRDQANRPGRPHHGNSRPRHIIIGDGIFTSLCELGYV